MAKDRKPVVHFKLEAPADCLERMTRDLDEAPTYMVRLEPHTDRLRIDAVSKVESGVQTDPTQREIAASSLFAKLPDAEGHPGPENRYETRRVLGEGGAGVVFEVKDHNIGREVAVKILKSDNTAADREAFIREGMLAAELEHPNIIPVYDLDTDDGANVYLTMKKVEGNTLKALIAARRSQDRYGIDDLPLIFLKVCDALSYAHSLGKVHQDVKPDNIMIGEYGEVFLIDWGASSSSGGDRQMSPVYMSPQQARGETANVSDDIYCLGATLFHALIGRPPTRALDIDKLWRKKAEGIIDHPDPKETESVPPALLAIAEKALQEWPEDRYQSVAEIAADLKSYQGGYATSAENASLLTLLRLFIQRRQKQVVAGILIATALIGMGSYHFWTIHQSDLARRNEANASVLEGRELVAKALASEDSKVREEHLISAQGAYRRSLFLDPGNQEARVGFRRASLLHFEIALGNKNWRQAEEKLGQSRDWGLPDTKFERRSKDLEEARTSRAKEIRNRIANLMKDASSSSRKVLHEQARQELIAMKDPVTIDTLIDYLDPEELLNPQKGDPLTRQLQLAIEALGWLGDERALPAILPFIERKAHGRSISLVVQEAAVIAACLLAVDNRDAFRKVNARLLREPGNFSSDLYRRVNTYVIPLAVRFGVEHGKVREWGLEAFAHIQAKRYQKAIDVYKRVLKESGSNPAIHSDIATASLLLGKHAESLVHIDKSIALDPKIPQYHLVRAKILMAMKRMIEAETAISQAIALRPDFWEAHVMRGAFLKNLGDIDAARKEFEQVIKHNKADATARILMAYTLVEIKDYDRALTVVNTLIQNGEDVATALQVRGSLYAATGRPRLALRDFEAALLERPVYYSAYWARSSLRMGMLDLEPALVDTDKALAINASSPLALRQRCALLRMLGREEKSLKAADDFAASFKKQGFSRKQADHSIAFLVSVIKRAQRGKSLVGQDVKQGMRDLIPRAAFLNVSGNLKGAATDYERAMKAAPDRFPLDIYGALADIALKEGRHRDRLNYYQDWAADPRATFSAYDQYAMELLYSRDQKLRDPEKALAMVSKAIKTMASKQGVPGKVSARIQSNLAKALYENGRIKEAVSAQEKALKLLPANTPAQERMSFQYFLSKYQRALVNPRNLSP